MKLFRKQIKITKKCRHVTVKKTDDRTTTGTLMRRPKPEVLALARSEISISLVHRLSLATGAGGMGFRKVCQSEPSLLTSKKRKKTKFCNKFLRHSKNDVGKLLWRSRTFLVKRHKKGPKVKLWHLCFGFASTSVSPPPGPSSQTEKFGKNPQVISKSFLVSMQICN